MTQENTELTELVRQRTENYFNAHKYCCSEAIMVVLNEGFNGGLPTNTVARLGAGFCGGMGGGEGVCGALSGAAAILGLLAGPGQKDGLSKKKLREASKKLHDQFKEKYGSTCCQDLTDHCRHIKKAKMKNCMAITGYGAHLVTSILLEYVPELSNKADIPFFSGHDSKFKALLGKVKSAM